MNESDEYANREAFLAPTKRRFKDVFLPVKGIKVRIRSLTEGEKEKFDSSMMARGGGPARSKVIEGRCRLCILCLCDGSGDPILSESDVDQLKSLDYADLGHLFEEVAQHCGIVDGDIEGMVGNSEDVRDDS